MTGQARPGAADFEQRWLRNLLRGIAAAMALVHTAVAVMQQSMNEDGISYLDMGDAYLQGDWGAAVNGIWSPAYAWLIAGVVRLVNPSTWWEFPVVQMTNFAIFVVAMFSFEFFWRHLTSRYCESVADRENAAGFPTALWLTLGYSLFIWVSLDLIKIWSVSPDMGVAAVVYVTAGLLLRDTGQRAGRGSAIVLGLLLGFGYLVKAALLPLGLVALFLRALAMTGTASQRARSFLLSVAAMLLVAGPLLGALSWSTGHLTMGDVGRFTYLKHVNQLPYPDFHTAVGRLGGAPAHPPRRIFDEPPIYEFAEPVAGTYPMAYDPGYWTAGLDPVVTATGQSRALLTSAMTWFDLFARQQGGFLALVLLLGVMSARRSPRRPYLNGTAALALWSLAAFGMYSLVHVLPRYVAPFVLLFWAAALAGMRFPADRGGRRLATAGAALLTCFVWMNLGVLNLDGIRRVTGFEPLSEAASQPGADAGNEVAHGSASHPEIADALQDMGLRRGDRVGFIGYSYSAYWARLARLRIVAEIHWHDNGRFWNAPDRTRGRAIEAFAGAGAVAVIAEPVPRGTQAPGWRPLGETGYLIYYPLSTERLSADSPTSD